MAANTAMPLFLLAVLLLLLLNADAYTNHTVGGTAGWFFNSTANSSAADYSAWATNQTFNLGDYLIFNTNTNLTVVQTYNLTTYNSCTMDDSLDSDTFLYHGGSNEFGDAVTIPVPLTIEGTQYYFSDANDGEQCQQGMAFQIKVSHGTGLPPSLNQPPPPPYAPPPASTVDVQPPPVTVIVGSRNAGIRTGLSFCLLVLVLLVSFAFLG